MPVGQEQNVGKVVKAREDKHIGWIVRARMCRGGKGKGSEIRGSMVKSKILHIIHGANSHIMRKIQLTSISTNILCTNGNLLAW